MRLTIAALLSLTLALTIISCKKEGTAGQGDEILIGEYASMTGSTATFGTSYHEGTVMAIEEANAAGGLHGKKIRLIWEDDRSDQNEASTAVQKLISRDKVCAVLGEVASKRSFAGAN